MSSMEQVIERWKYVCAGFEFLDRAEGKNSLKKLAKEEMCGWLDSFDQDMEALKEPLHLLLGRAFEDVPKSFEIMLKCDLEALEADPAEKLNEEFGSVAMWMVYQDIAEMCRLDMAVPDAMQGKLAEYMA